VFFALSIGVTSLVSIDNSDDESAVIIFWGLSIYYFFIILPAMLQYRNNKRHE